MDENLEGDHDLGNDHVPMWCGKDILFLRMNIAMESKPFATHEIQSCLHCQSDDVKRQELCNIQFYYVNEDEDIPIDGIHKTLKWCAEGETESQAFQAN